MVSWDHVGTLGYYAELLKRVTDSAFKEGEPGRELPPTTKDLGVRNGGDNGRGDQRPDTRNGGEPPADWVGVVPSSDPASTSAIRFPTSSS